MGYLCDRRDEKLTEEDEAGGETPVDLHSLQNT